jgi:hypothetical protein
LCHSFSFFADDDDDDDQSTSCRPRDVYQGNRSTHQIGKDQVRQRRKNWCCLLFSCQPENTNPQYKKTKKIFKIKIKITTKSTPFSPRKKTKQSTHWKVKKQQQNNTNYSRRRIKQEEDEKKKKI